MRMNLVLKDFQEPPKPTHCTLQKMAKMYVDNYSDDELAKRYLKIGDKLAWNEGCKNCKMPILLHNGPCTRQVEANTFEKIVEERDKFCNRMRNVIKDIEEQEKAKEKGTEQKDLLKTLIGVVEALKDSGGKVTKVVKPAKVPVWVQKMDLKTYEKALDIWIEQNKDLSENQRFYEVIESLKKE